MPRFEATAQGRADVADLDHHGHAPSIKTCANIDNRAKKEPPEGGSFI